MRSISRRSALLASAAIPALAIPATADADNPDAELVRLVDRAFELDAEIGVIGGQADELQKTIPEEIRFPLVHLGQRESGDAIYASDEGQINAAFDQRLRETVALGIDSPEWRARYEKRREGKLAELRDVRARHEAAMEACGAAELERQCGALCGELCAIHDRINELPALTVEGFKAKLRNFHKFAGPIPFEDDGTLESAALRSMVRDAGCELWKKPLA